MVVLLTQSSRNVVFEDSLDYFFKYCSYFYSLTILRPLNEFILVSMRK
jgi:hypothetical protein